MKTKLYAILFCLLLVADFSIHAQQKIIGGSAVDITQRPYQAAVFLNGSFTGGGVIIAENWILTAAHVVADHPASSFTVSTGYTNLNNDPRRSGVSQIIIHPNYNPQSLENDIALIKLSSSLFLGSTRKAITMSTSNSYSSGTQAVVSGWGRRSETGAASVTQLYKANVNIKSCTQTKITAEKSTNMSYRGDSGGPLTISSPIGDLLIGLVSSGQYVNPTNFETLYTNVGHYYNWIISYCRNPHSVSGPDLLEGTSTYTISPVPLNYSFDLSPNVSLVSQSGGNITIRAITQGRGYLNVKVNNQIVGQKFFWVGVPVISGITRNGSMLKVETFGISASIIQTHWTIGGNIFTSPSDFISSPYYSGTHTVTVRARNACGWSNDFTAQVSFSSRTAYDIAVDADAHSLTISPVKADTDISGIPLMPVGSAVKYSVNSILSGLQKASGTLPEVGGTIHLNNLPSDIYLLKLDLGDGNIQTFKFKLR